MPEVTFSNNKIVGTVPVTISLSENDVNDIMVGAIEGGINYWGYVTNANRQFKPPSVAVSEWCSFRLLNNQAVIFGDVEDDSEFYHLTLEKFMDGCKMHASNKGSFDMDCMDASDYDCIIQYALFGQVVYG